MKSIRELYRIGAGPSSSHTMAPRLAAERFRRDFPGAPGIRVTLYGSLAATGRGHLTDAALRDALAPLVPEIVWKPGEELPPRPLGMLFEALDGAGAAVASRRVFSIGGGAIAEDPPISAFSPSSPGPASSAPSPASSAEAHPLYDLGTMAEILARCEKSGQALWEYVQEREGAEIFEFLGGIWTAMHASMERGLRAEGVLPGGLGLSRKARAIYRKTQTGGAHFRRTGLLAAYALAVAEENASGGVIVTAPTCGSSGVLPAVLGYVQETVNCDEADILRALATAGLVGNLVKHNASIAGAEVGCQGEIGTACAMGAAAAAQLYGAAPRQIEYAAEMGLEHHLGLTCDPVGGLVQIPCIERNAHAATRAVTCAEYALFTDGSHRIPFDETVAVMGQTGHDLPSLYRETASGGLAAAFSHRKR